MAPAVGEGALPVQLRRADREDFHQLVWGRQDQHRLQLPGSPHQGGETCGQTLLEGQKTAGSGILWNKEARRETKVQPLQPDRDPQPPTVPLCFAGSKKFSKDVALSLSNAPSANAHGLRQEGAGKIPLLWSDGFDSGEERGGCSQCTFVKHHGSPHLQASKEGAFMLRSCTFSTTSFCRRTVVAPLLRQGNLHRPLFCTLAVRQCGGLWYLKRISRSRLSLEDLQLTSVLGFAAAWRDHHSRALRQTPIEAGGRRRGGGTSGASCGRATNLGGSGS